MASMTVTAHPKIREIDRPLRKNARVLIRFASIYCDHQHAELGRSPYAGKGKLAELQAGEEPPLCADCAAVLSYGLGKLLLCPYHPKPACKHCPTPCYTGVNQQKMRAMMRFSGKWLVQHGRFDLLFKLMF